MVFLKIKNLSININEFRDKKIRYYFSKKDKVCVFIGKRETGKSFSSRFIILSSGYSIRNSYFRY